MSFVHTIRLLYASAVLTAVWSAWAADAGITKSIPIAKVKHSGPVDFEREILPILKSKCLACHNETKPKGGLVLETPHRILKGGDNGPAVVPKKPATSLLLKAAAHQDPELIMPPADNKVAAMPLTPNELGLVQLWIEQGAKGQVRASAPIVWQPIPPTLTSIYAVALTRDGQFAACGRANRVFIYHLPTRRLAARLNDPQLQKQKASNAGTAHRDTVNSLAFSPDGEWLASGGYREVKLWRRGKRTESSPTTNDLALMIRRGKLLSATITNGELRAFDTNGAIVRTNSFTRDIAALKGDFRARWLVEERERELTFAQSEIDYGKAGVKTAESNQMAAVARQKKAAETNAALVKAASEKRVALTNALATQRDSENAVRDLGPEVSALVSAFFSAEKEFTNATAMAKAAKDRSEKSRGEQLAAESLIKSNALVDAKAALEKLPAETKAAQKLATEKLTVANKALADAEKELAKAERARQTAEHELQLADESVLKTDASLATAKSVLASVEAETKRVEAALETAKAAFEKTESPVRSLAYSTDDRTLLVRDDAGAVRFWSEMGVAFDGNWNAPWKLERAIGSDEGRSLLADRINALRFTHDGEQLITGGGEPTRGGEIKLWRVKDGLLLRDFGNVHSDSVLALDVSADGKQLASGGADRFAKAIDLASGKVRRVFEGHTHHVLGVSWRRDGRTLLTAGADNVAKVWDATTGERRKNIDGFGKEITAAAFVGVSDQAVLGAGDGQVVLVKSNGEKVRSFAASDFVNSVAVTPDGNIVLAGGADGVLRAWDGKSGKLLVEFKSDDSLPVAYSN